jgi:hypothetical protein
LPVAAQGIAIGSEHRTAVLRDGSCQFFDRHRGRRTGDASRVESA